MTEGLRPSRWLWITPELRNDRSTGALVYSMGLAQAVARASDADGAPRVDMTMVGIGHDVAPIDNTRLEVVAGSLRGGWRSLLSPLPNLAYACAIEPFVERCDRLLAESWDVVVVDGLQAAWAMDLVQQQHRGVSVFIAHNHEATLRSGVAAEARWVNGRRVVLTIDAWKARRLERATTRSADVVTSITADDLERFVTDAPDSIHVEVTPGWSGEARHTSVPFADRPRRVGILGSFDWHVKQENLRRFLPVADPIFERAGIELVIGGKVPAEFRDEFGSSLRATRFEGWAMTPSRHESRNS